MLLWIQLNLTINVFQVSGKYNFLTGKVESVDNRQYIFQMVDDIFI